MCRSADRRGSHWRYVSGLAFAMVALGLQVSPAALAEPVGSLRAASSVSAPQGGTVSFAGTVPPSIACPASAPVQLTSTPPGGGANLFPGGLGPMAPRDAGGNFRATFVIPPSTPVGTYTIGLICGQSTAGISEVLNVTAAPGASPKITVSPTSAHPGDAIAISGAVPTTGPAACPTGDAVTLTSTRALFPPDGVGPQVPRDASGNFRTTYKISAATPPGTFSIGMRCGSGNVGIQAALQVTATAATTTTTSTATTTTTSMSTTTSPSIATTPTTAIFLVPPTTAPGTTASSLALGLGGNGKSSKSPLRWVALGGLALVVLAGAAIVLARRRGRV